MAYGGQNNKRLAAVRRAATVRARALQKNLKAQGFEVTIADRTPAFIRMDVSADGYSVPVEFNVTTNHGYHTNTLDEPKVRVGPVRFEGARLYHKNHRLAQRCYTKTADAGRLAGRVAAYHADAGVPYLEARVARADRIDREGRRDALRDRARDLGLTALTIDGPASDKYSITGLDGDTVGDVLDFIANGPTPGGAA